MKKLRIYDHNGQIWREFDVYLEGEGFTWRSPKPEAVWLGSIVIEDATEEPKVPEVVEFVAVGEPMTEEEAKFIQEGIEEDARREAQIMAIEEKKEPREIEDVIEDIRETIGQVEEVIDESTEVSNSSSGESRPSETGESEGIERVPKKAARGKTTKRGKRVRNTKAT